MSKTFEDKISVLYYQRYDDNKKMVKNSDNPTVDDRVAEQ